MENGFGGPSGDTSLHKDEDSFVRAGAGPDEKVYKYMVGEPVDFIGVLRGRRFAFFIFRAMSHSSYARS